MGRRGISVKVWEGVKNSTGLKESDFIRIVEPRTRMQGFE